MKKEKGKLVQPCFKKSSWFSKDVSGEKWLREVLKIFVVSDFIGSTERRRKKFFP